MKKILMLLFMGNIAMAAVGMDKMPVNTVKPENTRTHQINKFSFTSVYQDGAQNGRQVKKDDDEITVRTKDGIKVKAQPGKSKVETATYETKIKGDERKYKSKTNNTKIKTEPGKAKFESDDTKIKIKERD